MHTWPSHTVSPNHQTSRPCRHAQLGTSKAGKSAEGRGDKGVEAQVWLWRLKNEDRPEKERESEGDKLEIRKQWKERQKEETKEIIKQANKH